MHKQVAINSRLIGIADPTFIIAEVSQSHDGSLGMAHAFIDAAADVGADAIKFQTHIAAAESTQDEPFRVQFSRQDATRYAYWQRMEFSEAQWRGLALHAQERGIIFLSSAFSVPAVEMLSEIKMPAWKVGSGEVWSDDVLTAMVKAGGPILLSTGMSSWSDIDSAVNILSEKGAAVALFQCTSKYPTPLESVGLNVLEQMRERFDVPIGLSDHSGTPYPGLAAIALGYDLLELHVTFDKRLFGPDVVASVTFEELAMVVNMRDAMTVIGTNPVDKDRMAEDLKGVRQTFGKSIAVSEFVEKGTTLNLSHLTLKKPATGIPSHLIEDMVGRRTRRDLYPDRLLREEDLE